MLEGWKIFKTFMYGQSSITAANLVKIGLVDVEIIDLKEITNI